MFKWKKQGLIFCPDGSKLWMHNYAQIPFPVDFGDFLRIYFATREKYSGNMVRAYGAFVDLDKNDLQHVINVASEPLVRLGDTGEFDEFGSMPCSVVKNGDFYFLYYVGWTRCSSVPYDWEIGLAISTDGAHFERYGRGPLIGPTPNEPYLNSTPIVYNFDGIWHMFYHTGLKWIKQNNKVESQYIIKHATSADGITWNRNNKPVLPLIVENECQTSPSIIKISDKYHMFFCYRQGLDFREDRCKSYRIGYAYSYDLENWIRDDSQAGIDISEYGWDSQMIEYPHVTKVGNQYVMFYCGNHFGQGGFGYATLAGITE